jgi:glyoxylase-like metal-dependent hydrolase (beta-lactamase superfamily II)
MRQIVPDVYLIERLRGAHVYLLASAEGLTLVDSGVASDAGQIVAQLEAGGHALSDLQVIVLTHCHGDHMGGVAELVRRSGARVLAHRVEVPYIEQSESLPYTSLGKKLLFWLYNHIAPTQPCTVDRELHDGDVVEALGGLQVIHAPGHTPGSIVLYQPERHLVFCGDVIFHGVPLSRGGEVQAPPRIVSVDVAQAEASARKVAGLPVETICFGHGEPIVENAKEVLQAI